MMLIVQRLILSGISWSTVGSAGELIREFVEHKRTLSVCLLTRPLKWYRIAHGFSSCKIYPTFSFG